jgi:hypothetical protein
MPYVSQSLDWGQTPAEDRRDKLIVNATDVATATVDAKRARVSCRPEVDLSQAPGLKLRIDCRGLRRR